MTNDIILMKLGGSLLTNKRSQTPICHYSNIKRIANIISKSDKKIIIVHGAGSYAHPIVKKYNINNGVDGTKTQKKAIIKARKQVRDLNEILCNEISQTGLKCESVVPSQSMKINNNKKIINLPKKAFDKILSKGKIAITFGDIVNIGSENVGILSGDTLLLELAQIYKPKRTFFIMDYPGVVKGKLESKKLKIYDKIDSTFLKDKIILKDEDRPDVTGGLINKIKCALEISKTSECWISGLDYLEDCLKDKPKGTKVIP